MPTNRFSLVAIGVIALAVFAAYSNSFAVPFIFDDYHNIETNPGIQLSEWSSETISKAAFENPTPRPVAYLTFALNYYLDGLEVWGYHLFNTIVHAVNGILVYLLVVMIFRITESGITESGITEADDQGPGDNRPAKAMSTNRSMAKHQWTALAVALVFVLHPVQTQSVTYIVQRMASLCSLFYFAALLAYLYGRLTTSKRNRVIWWVSCVLFFGLALGTKQFAVTLPLAVLMFEWLLFREGRRDWMLRNIKYLVAIVVVMAMVAFVFKGAEFHKLFTRGFSKRDFSLFERLMTQGRVMVHYITLFLLPLPSRLTLIYDFPLSRSLFAPITTLIAWTAIVSAVTWALLNTQKHRLVSLCVLWFFLHLAVESTILPLEMVYEHRLYLPLFGACLLAVIAVFRLVGDHGMARLAIGLLCVFLAGGTFMRNNTWQSQVSIWSDNIQKQPGESRSYFNLGVDYANRGDLDRSFELISRAIELEPRFQQAFVRRGMLYEMRRELPAAMKDFDSALTLKHKEIRGGAIRDTALSSRALLHLRMGQLPQALTDIDEALQLRPGIARYHLARGSIVSGLERELEAVVGYRRAIEIDNNLLEAHNNLAWILATSSDLSLHDGKQAVQHATMASKLTKWQNVSTLSTLAAAYARSGDFENAVRWQLECIELTPVTDKARQRKRLELYKAKQPLIQ